MATVIGSTRRLTPGRRTVADRRTRTLGGPRPRRRDRGGVDEPQRWWPAPLIVSLAIVTGFAVVVFLAWLGWSIYVVVHVGAAGSEQPQLMVLAPRGVLAQVQLVDRRVRPL